MFSGSIYYIDEFPIALFVTVDILSFGGSYDR